MYRVKLKWWFQTEKVATSCEFKLAKKQRAISITWNYCSRHSISQKGLCRKGLTHSLKKKYGRTETYIVTPQRRKQRRVERNVLLGRARVKLKMYQMDRLSSVGKKKVRQFQRCEKLGVSSMRTLTLSVVSTEKGFRGIGTY